MKLLWMAFLLMCVPAVIQAQAAPEAPAKSACSPASPDRTKQPDQANCVASAPTNPPASERFPYPGDSKAPSSSTSSSTPQSGDPAKDFPYPGESGPPAAPAPSLKPRTGDPSKDFPYPGGGSSSSSGESSSSDSSSSDSNSSSSPDMPPSADTPPRGRRVLPKVKQLQSDEDRESEDLDIAKYYMQSGNFMAAYLRAKDAAKLQPGDSEAHFAVADAAQRLGKKDEAVTEYSEYLKLDPDGDRVKPAKKALASLR